MQRGRDAGESQRPVAAGVPGQADQIPCRLSLTSEALEGFREKGLGFRQVQ